MNWLRAIRDVALILATGLAFVALLLGSIVLLILYPHVVIPVILGTILFVAVYCTKKEYDQNDVYWNRHNDKPFGK